MTTRHATSLTNGEIVEENDLGSIRRVTAHQRASQACRLA